ILLGRRRFEREGVDGAAHGVTERGVDEAVPIDGAFAHEGRGHDRRREVVAAARRVGHGHLGVGQRGADAGSDGVGRDRPFSAGFIAGRRGRGGPPTYTGGAMRLGMRVTVVTTVLVAAVLAATGWAALRVRRADLEADLSREAREIAAALRAGLEPLEAETA